MAKTIYWDGEKNEWLKEKRGVCFEEVVLILAKDEALDIVEHPNQEKYPGQKIILVKINDYVYLVPYLEDEKGVFLKTMIPSRKATEKYLRRRK
jgi:uncharacterized DUF497 family protein